MKYPLSRNFYVRTCVKFAFANKIRAISSADMCLNCSLSVKSTKIGMMTVFKALKKIGYGAIAKTTVKGHLKGSLKTAAILNRK